MSGALETAASAFAIVGVTDVVLRTGRELYHLLSDVLDAPDEVKRVNECIRETIRLVDALNVRAQLNVDASIIASVQEAVKALSRELKSLKIILAKFKGAKTTWSRIKYVLNEKKVAKTLINLERSKSLLVTSLVIIYGELAASNFQSISPLLVQINTKGQHSLDKQDAHHQALQSQLNDHSKQHQQGISALQLNQANFSSRQEDLLHTSKQTEKRTVVLEEKVQRASHSSRENHRKTRDLLSDKFETLQIALTKNLVCSKKSGNKVYFRGERVKMIMTYLRLVEDELDTAINQVSAQSYPGGLTQEILLLHQELQNLLGSAAQEEAARYARSTATSFDEWHFPGIDNGFSTSAAEGQEHERKYEETDSSESHAYKPRQIRKRAKLEAQTLSFETNSGELQLFISQRKPTEYDTEKSHNLSLSFTNHAQPLTIIDIQFTQFLLQQTRPRICAHLNVFTLVTESQGGTFQQLFGDNATLEDIDNAIRQGSISPYCLNYGGSNYILYEAAEHGRIDVLQYLESHGIGITGLRQDESIFQGLDMGHGVILRGRDLAERTLSTFEYVQDLVYDSTSILADLILSLISFYYGKRSLFVMNVPVLDGYLAKLHKEGYDCAKYKLGILNMKSPRWDRQTLCELISLLIKAGANILLKDALGQGFISQLMTYHIVDYTMLWALEDLLYAFVQAGADVHDLDDKQQTCSVVARDFEVWPLWCKTLHDNGKNIEEVLRAEGNEWLLSDDWEDIFLERFGDRENTNYLNDYDESDSDVETLDEDDENAGSGEDKIEIDCDDEEDSEDGHSKEEGSDNENSDEE